MTERQNRMPGHLRLHGSMASSPRGWFRNIIFISSVLAMACGDAYARDVPLLTRSNELDCSWNAVVKIPGSLASEPSTVLGCVAPVSYWHYMDKHAIVFALRADLDSLSTQIRGENISLPKTSESGTGPETTKVLARVEFGRYSSHLATLWTAIVAISLTVNVWCLLNCGDGRKDDFFIRAQRYLYRLLRLEVFAATKRKLSQRAFHPQSSSGSNDKPAAATNMTRASELDTARISGAGGMPAGKSTQQALGPDFAHKSTDSDIIAYFAREALPLHSLEKVLQDCPRAVRLRRLSLSMSFLQSEHCARDMDWSQLPYEDYDWTRVHGACCESVIGFMPIPVGVAGPLLVDGIRYHIPMATTEGVLVASTSRGCSAITASGGARTVLSADGMTRAPVLSFDTLERAGAAKAWLDSLQGQATSKRAFNSTSRFARLISMRTALAGTLLFVRFKATTGDAMGMNMVSKGTEHVLRVMKSQGFPDMEIVSLSGNYCTDKKASAINWVDGRGKSVVAEATIPAHIVTTVLKTDVDKLVELNQSKNLIGSAMAGSLGGFNAHSANVVTAIFLATGQDPAQVVESASCITIMKNVRGSLQISVSMPSLEVGTLGGGTILGPQGAMLDMLGVRGPHATSPGDNARTLACVIAAAVLAGELSLCSALATGHLVAAHMQYNRAGAKPPKVK